MVRGTTQTFRISFKLDTPIENIDRTCVAFAYGSSKKPIFEIDSSDAIDRFSFDTDVDGNTVLQFKLTKEESMKLKEGTQALQVMLKTVQGDIIASNIYNFSVEPVICTSFFSS